MISTRSELFAHVDYKSIARRWNVDEASTVSNQISIFRMIRDVSKANFRRRIRFWHPQGPPADESRIFHSE